MKVLGEVHKKACLIQNRRFPLSFLRVFSCIFLNNMEVHCNNVCTHESRKLSQNFQKTRKQ